jgi:hypothetical protein
MQHSCRIATETQNSTESSLYFCVSVAIILMAVINACTSDSPMEDPFREFITENYSLVPSHQEVHPGAGEIFNAGGLVAPTNSENLIVLDHADHTVKVLNTDGVIVHTTGGHGRGPGELGDYARLYYGDDRLLYVMDPLNHRIHIFQNVDDTLVLLETNSYEYPAAYHLSSIYSTETGFYGLFSQSENTFFTPDNRYYLYKLDQNFSMKEKLLELPGEQRTRRDDPNFTFYLPNIFAEKTLWDMDGDWFYHMSSHKPQIHRYHLPTGETETLEFLQIPLREHHSEIIPLIIDHFDPDDGQDDMDQRSSVLYENDSLPMFVGFIAEENRLFMQAYFTPGDQGIILMADPETKKVRYFEAPHGFDRFTMREKMIYGIDYESESGEYTLMRIRLEY